MRELETCLMRVLDLICCTPSLFSFRGWRLALLSSISSSQCNDEAGCCFFILHTGQLRLMLIDPRPTSEFKLDLNLSPRPRVILISSYAAPVCSSQPRGSCTSILMKCFRGKGGRLAMRQIQEATSGVDFWLHKSLDLCGFLHVPC